MLAIAWLPTMTPTSPASGCRRGSSYPQLGLLTSPIPGSGPNWFVFLPERVSCRVIHPTCRVANNSLTCGHVVVGVSGCRVDVQKPGRKPITKTKNVISNTTTGVTTAKWLALAIDEPLIKRHKPQRVGGYPIKRLIVKLYKYAHSLQPVLVEVPTYFRPRFAKRGPTARQPDSPTIEF